MVCMSLSFFLAVLCVYIFVFLVIVCVYVFAFVSFSFWYDQLGWLGVKS